MQRMCVTTHKQHRKLIDSLTTLLSEQIMKLQGKAPAKPSIGRPNDSVWESNSLIDIGKEYSKMELEGKMGTLLALAGQGIRNVEFLSKLSDEFVLDPDKLFRFSPLILSSVAELGFYTEDWAQNMLGTMTRVYMSNKGFLFQSDITNWIWGLIMLKAPYNAVVKAIEVSNSLGKQRVFGVRDILLKTHFEQNPYSVEYSSALTQSEIDQILDPLNLFGLSDSVIEATVGVLRENGIEAQALTTVSGVWAPFFIPSKRTVIWPLSVKVQTSTKEVLRGSMFMHYNQLTNVSDKVITFNYSAIQEDPEAILNYINKE